MLFKCLDDIEDSEHSDGTACSETLIRLMSASSKIEGFSLSQLLWVFRRTSGTTEFALLPQPQMSSVPLGRRLRASQERDLTPPNPAPVGASSSLLTAPSLSGAAGAVRGEGLPSGCKSPGPVAPRASALSY